MSLFRELRRRSVFKVAIAYVATAWVLAEVADYAADNFGAPDWVVQMFTVLLILGFPLAMIMAWAFELTPQGVRRAADMPFVREGDAGEATEKSIAVLPFANLSPDRENEYFADGLSEELLNVLAHMDDLRVAGRTSCFAFKGQNVDLREIGRKLNVGHILEGSVRKSDNRLRITAQLVSASDGYHLWSETFNRELDDIFVIQDEIARAVTDVLRVKLLGEAEPEVRRTEGGKAYAAYLEGRFHQRRMKPEDLRKALKLYEAVLDESPDYVPALAASAETWAHLVASGEVAFADGWPRAQAFITRALDVDPDYAEAQMVRGFFLGWWERRMEAGEKHLRRAIQLNPNSPDAHRRLGAHLRLQVRFDEALPHMETAVSLDPLSILGLRQLGYTHACMGQLSKAEELFRKGLELDPEAGGLHYNLAELYLRQNELKRAKEEAAKEPVEWARQLVQALVAIRESPDRANAPVDDYERRFGDIGGFQMGILYCQKGEPDKALDWLEKAEQQRDPGLMQMRVDPLLEPIREETRFVRLMEKLNLVQRPEIGNPGS